MKKIFVLCLVLVIGVIGFAFLMYNAHEKGTAISDMVVYNQEAGTREYYDEYGTYGSTQGRCDVANTIFTDETAIRYTGMLSFSAALSSAEKKLKQSAVCYADGDSFAVAIKFDKNFLCIDSWRLQGESYPVFIEKQIEGTECR